MRDHYVEIHTDRGSELVLMRFGDALKELGGAEGMQVHRSHWIARAAVRKIVRRAGRTVAFLENGAEVPVSRRYARALSDANWVLAGCRKLAGATASRSSASGGVVAGVPLM